MGLPLARSCYAWKDTPVPDLVLVFYRVANLGATWCGELAHTVPGAALRNPAIPAPRPQLAALTRLQWAVRSSDLGLRDMEDCFCSNTFSMQQVRPLAWQILSISCPLLRCASIHTRNIRRVGNFSNVAMLGSSCSTPPAPRSPPRVPSYVLLFIFHRVDLGATWCGELAHSCPAQRCAAPRFQPCVLSWLRSRDFSGRFAALILASGIWKIASVRIRFLWNK